MNNKKHLNRSKKALKKIVEINEKHTQKQKTIKEVLEKQKVQNNLFKEKINEGKKTSNSN